MYNNNSNVLTCIRGYLLWSNVLINYKDSANLTKQFFADKWFFVKAIFIYCMIRLRKFSASRKNKGESI